MALLRCCHRRRGTAILWTNNDDGLFRKLLLCLCAIASSKASSAATYRLPDSHLIQHVFSPQMANATTKRNSCHPTRAVHFYSQISLPLFHFKACLLWRDMHRQWGIFGHYCNLLILFVCRTKSNLSFQFKLKVKPSVTSHCADPPPET